MRLPLEIGVGRMRTLKSPTSEEKDLIKRMFRQFTPEEQEYIDFVKADKQELWEENKQLKAALEKAAEIVAKNFCPANHDCPLEEMAFGNCEGDPECTQERAEKCWMDYWMGNEEQDE